MQRKSILPVRSPLLMSSMRFGFLVPVYNHGAALESVVKKLVHYAVPVIIVDDGNGAADRAYISAVAARYSEVIVVTRAKNGGKGKAVIDGVKKAYELGLTHIFQIDSDGQHDAERAGHFLELSREHPDAVICGFPEYDADAPEARVKGRAVANGWIHFVTLSQDIKDGMIGFRIYPVEPFYRLIQRHAAIDARMGCDIEILVRLFWAGVPIISESVKVNYPEDGISNFHVVRDNIRISLVYARLCIGMIFRLPKLILWRRQKKGKRV